MLLDPLVFCCAEAWLYLLHCRQVWLFRRRIGAWPNIARPRTYVDRMLWRKAVDHNPLFVRCADKLSAKDYIRERFAEARIPRTLWSGRDADAIPDEMLRGDVWVKASHGWNLNLEIKGGAVDRAELKARTDRWLASVHGRHFYEWASLRPNPRLLVEEAIKPPGAGLLWEFEVRIASGRFVLGSMVRCNKRADLWRVYLDREGCPLSDTKVLAAFGPTPFPSGLDYLPRYREAVRVAERVGGELDYARIDFLWDGERLFSGEITIYPSAGLSPLASQEMDDCIMGGWRLSESGFLRHRQPWPVSIYADALRRALARTEGAPDAV
jgi:hypothetical protein